MALHRPFTPLFTPLFTRLFTRRITALFLAACCTAPAQADPVLDGAQAGLELLRGLEPSARARIRVLADTAVFNALNAIDRRYAPHEPSPLPITEASAEAAVASARWTVFALQPELPHERLQAAYRAALAQVPDSPAKARGIRLGEQAAAAVLAARSGNRSADIAARPDPGAPPALDSALARRDIAEVKAVGAHDSAVRSADQTAAVLFWNSSHEADLLPLFSAIAKARGFTAVDSARMLALWSIAEYEASLAIGAFKGRYRALRPDAAIRATPGPAELRDPSWSPLLNTPAHPEYPSGGAVVAGVYEAVLDRFHPGSGVPLVLTNRSLGLSRGWTSPHALACELAESRVWGGLHYRNTVEASWRLGRAIAEEVLDEQLRPLQR